MMESASSDRLSLALLASSEGVWDWYIDHSDIYYSDKALEILGYTKESAPNLLTNPEIHFHPDDLAAYQKAFDHSILNNNHDILSVDARHKHPTKGWLWLRIRGIVIRDKVGQAIRLVGTIIDISNRKIAETALREERHRLHELVEAIPVNVYYKNTKSQFVLANTSTAKKLGVSTVEDLLGKTDHDFFDSNHADIARTNELEIMRTGIPQMNIIERETWDDKDDTWGETCKMPWLNSKGKVQGIFGITTDITKIVRTQQKLARVAEELHARNQSIEEEIKLAREIQQALLPRNLDDYSLQSDRRQVHFSHRYEPASDMAGDFFEIMPISDTQLGVLICDVMGHGVRSSLIVSMLRGLIEKEREAAVHPEWFIYGINDGLVSILERAKVTLFATAIYCVIDLKRGTFQYTTAGHHAPIIVKDGQAQQLEADQHKKPEPALGLIPNAPYTSETIPLDNIDRVLLFTDGLYEIENHDGQHLEIDKITAMMMKTHDMDLDKSLSFLISQARQHSRYGEFDDDLCLLGMDIKRLEQT